MAEFKAENIPIGCGRWYYLAGGVSVTSSIPENVGEQAEDAFSRQELLLSDWLWRPWYAKLWWAAIPLYWLTMGEPTRPECLQAFAESGYAVATNILFIPITPLAMFGLRFFRFARAVGRLEPAPRDEFRIFDRYIDEESWSSLRNPNRFRNAWIRENLKF